MNNCFKIKNSKNRNKKNVILIAIIIFFVIFFSFFSKNISDAFYSFSNPIQKSLAFLGNETSFLFGSFNKKISLEKENQALIKERQDLIIEIILLKEIEEENNILKEAMRLGLDEDFNLILAEISGFDFLEDSFLINKGEKDGILAGMPVVNQKKVIIGRVFDVYEKFSKIMLITHEESVFFDARVQGKEAMGVIKGKGKFNLILDLISKDKEIKEGDFVVTMGEIFPGGLPIGKIKKVIKNDADPFQQAEILPFFNPKTMKNVFIITDYQK